MSRHPVPTIPDQPPYKAFLGNLPRDAVLGDIETILRSLEIDDDEIRRFEVKMVRDRESDEFKGFAYVQVNTAEQLQKMLNLKGVMFEGRPLKVDVATPRDPAGRGGRGGARGGRGGGHGGGGYGGEHAGHHNGERGQFGRASGPEDPFAWHGVERGRRGGRSDRGGGYVRESRNSQSEEGDVQQKSDEQPSEPLPPRPRLQLKPRTTDPKELEEKKKREEEEEKQRRAKIFGEA